MNKLKNIYAFGTSHTAGGGFEFNTISNTPNPNIYKKIINSENHFDFSYPSILSKIIGIDVDNRAKQGYGYEKVTREIVDVVGSGSFDKDSSIFLIEVSDWSRQEFYHNDINNYVIINGYNETDITEDELSIAHDYHFQSIDIISKLDTSKNIFANFLSKTFDLDITIQKVQTNFLFLINFLENNGINYYLTNGDIVLPPVYNPYLNHTDKILKYELYNRNTNENIKVDNWIDCISDFGLTITNESQNKVKDNHQGLSVNMYVANAIYNKMISDNYIKGEPIHSTLKNEWSFITNKLKSLL